ncbi:hypothetical protein CFP56_032808 [Quercus suber]|uniref:Zinc knuckle CX2CX4HX4C domain-containing protein n=1 Tax=Quercus suber TaxID=58331 RepID=A0AAW0JFS7_QUESU
MDDLTISWKKLSLSDKEGKKLALVKNKKRVEFVLAAKFLTKRSVSADVVAKTFRACLSASPKTQTRTHKNALKLPRQCVLSPFQKLPRLASFSSFRWDPHNLDDENIKLSDITQNSLHPNKLLDLYGVRVVISVSVMRYERLPNICYWCRMVSHDDKDCSIWLSSKCSLKIEDQQFGNWIRAALVNPSRKSVMDVKGFKKEDTHSRASSFSNTSFSSVHEGILALKPVLETTGEADCSIRADLRPVMEFSPVGDARQREQLQFFEERLKVFIADLKEDANKGGHVAWE